MTAENGVAQVWAAILGMCFFIACTLTVGYWLFVYHEEAESMRPYLIEPTSAAQLILDDILIVGW